MIVLGLSHLAPSAIGHDASVCLVDNGKLVSAVSEERFNGVKHYAGYPAAAIDWTLKDAGLKLSDVDRVAVGFGLWKRPKSLPKMIYGAFKTNSNVTFKQTPMQKKNPTFIDHQLSHASCGHRMSGFDKALIISLDGAGVDAGKPSSGGIFVGNGDSIETLKTFPLDASLGFAYGAFTVACGFWFGDGEGKTMGLAPFANDKPQKDLDACFAKVSGMFPRFDGTEFVGGGGFRTASRLVHGSHLVEFDNPQLNALRERYGSKVLAWAAQKALEESASGLVAAAQEETGINNIVLTGGLFYNVVLNKIIRERLPRSDIFVTPVAGDQGVAIGAALELSHREGVRLSNKRMADVYLGPEYGEGHISDDLKKYGCSFERVDPSSTAASLVESGKVVGWFQGRMELGPRALGSRSILANPTDIKYKDITNDKVKHRESWRPFCPSMTIEASKEYLANPVEAPFMITAFDCVCPDDVPAVVHVDGTTRPQTLRRGINPAYYDAIHGAGGIVLNTSFNLAGDPIVCTPADAIMTFKNSGMDALVIGDFLVSKG